MALPRITYYTGTQTWNIDLATMPRSLNIDVMIPRSTHMTLTGLHDTTTVPRVDIHVQADWFVDSLSLYVDLETWWNAAHNGEVWSLALDSNNTVDTRTAVDASIGDTTVYVNDPSGITTNQRYRIIDGPHHQFVDVSSVSGDLITLTGALRFNIGAGAVFRDQFYWRGIIPDGTGSPFRILTPQDGQILWPPPRFIFSVDFTEDISEETIMLFKALSANATGVDSASAQPWFPSAGGVTLAANTSYFFEGYLRTSRAAGTTSHSTAILFGGTAVLTNIVFELVNNTGDTVTAGTIGGVAGESASGITFKAASTSATEQIFLHVTGLVRVNTAGTFIPQFVYSAAPGGAPTILANSYFRLWPEGSGSVVSRGTWA